jgi:hypothetical protein
VLGCDNIYSMTEEAQADINKPILHPRDKAVSDWALAKQADGKGPTQIMVEFAAAKVPVSNYSEYKLMGVIPGATTGRKMIIFDNNGVYPRLGADSVLALDPLSLKEEKEVNLFYPRFRKDGTFEPEESRVYKFGKGQYDQILEAVKKK